MRTYHTLSYRDCTAFGAAVESPRLGPAIGAALARGEVIEVQGHRFRLCRSGSGWKIKTATLWQMTHRQRFARLMRCLRLGGDEVLWEARVRRFVKHCALRVENGGDGRGGGGVSHEVSHEISREVRQEGSHDRARPRMVPLYVKGWLPPALDATDMSAESREAGRRRRAELLRHARRPQAEPDGASEGSAEVPPQGPPLPSDIDLRRLCPDVAAHLLGAGADLRGRNLRDSDLGPLDLGGADLRGAVLVRCKAIGAGLVGADLQGADLRGADLRRARLDGAKLAGTRLAAARLQNASLHDADLRGQTLDMMALAGAALHGANLTDARLVLAHDALIDGAVRRAVLKPLHQREDNLLWTLASLPDRDQRRGLMQAIVRALAHAVTQGEDVSDTHDALAGVLLKNIDDYWGDPGDMNADIALNGWIQTLARHQCLRLADALPEPCEGALLQLADRYRAMFAERGGLPWEVPLTFRPSSVSRA
ncbi:Pentapeptide repeat-containing protein [Cupriavidus sp. H18C1]